MDINPLDEYLYREHIKKKRALEKSAKDKESDKESDKELDKEPVKTNYFILFIVLAVLVIFTVFVGKALMTPKEVYSERAYWQALIDINICGEHKDLPRTDNEYLGNSLVNTRNDNIFHVEGMVESRDQITLGNFFDAIKVHFDKDAIMDVKNGDLCDGKPGKLRMYVNERERDDFRNYMISPTRKAEDQVIKLIFEPEQQKVII